jgi:hypothetical protein
VAVKYTWIGKIWKVRALRETLHEAIAVRGILPKVMKNTRNQKAGDAGATLAAMAMPAIPAS